MNTNEIDEILGALGDPKVAESGGAHNNIGVDFQRHWAILRMFELTEDGEDDFLFLFEAIQDVAIVDSISHPSRIQIFQVKKKDRNEWTWSDLTGLHNPSNKRKLKPLESIQSHPLGKLYATIRKFKTLNSTGCFVSNTGCALPKAAGGEMAAAKKEILDGLSVDYKTLLCNGLSTYHTTSEALPDLNRMYVERVDLPPRDPGATLVGHVYEFLKRRSDEHSGQARALVDALLGRVGRLSHKSQSYANFQDLCRACGLSKAEFEQSLGSLENVPDLKNGLDLYISRLMEENLPIPEIHRLRVSAAAHFRRKVLAGLTQDETRYLAESKLWIMTNGVHYPITAYLAESQDALAANAGTLSISDQRVLILIATLQYQ